jgi:hypothetical protein
MPLDDFVFIFILSRKIMKTYKGLDDKYDAHDILLGEHKASLVEHR